MELTRKQVIEELQKMLDYCSIRQDSTPEMIQALVYAMASLKTDETYQIMYEGVEVYDKDTVLWMFRELQLYIQELNTAPQFLTDDNVKDFRECVDTIIQQKIDKLRGEESG